LPLDFIDGFAITQTEQTIYGNAELWIHGEGFIHTFDILCGMEGKAGLGIPDDIKIGNVADITLSIGGEPITGASITLVNPEDYEYNFVTDSQGQIHPVMDIAGEWTARTSFKEQQIVKKISVSFKTLSVSTNKELYNVGEKVGVVTGEDHAEITVKKDNAIMLQTTVETGYVEFFPEQSGTYKINAVSDDKKGSNSFNVKMPLNIRVLDENNMQTTLLKKDKQYIVQVFDENGDTVSAYNEILISQSIQGGYVALNNGIGFWTPDKTGQITLSVNDKDNYVGCETMVSVESNDNMMIYAVAVIAVLIVLFIIYYLYKKGILHLPSLPKRKKIPDKIL